jgi:Zn finger protein HypA/HybF involved in hydrogenase expression
MHEYAFMQEIITAILSQLSQEAPPGGVAEVVLKVGVFEVHSEAAARQAFQVLARGTPLESSRLTLDIVPPVCHCQSCGLTAPFAIEHHHAHDPLPMAECPQCGVMAVLSGGRGVDGIELVLAEAGESP